VASKYYVEGTGRAAKVEDLFAAVAPRYDVINDLQSLGMHRVWKRRLVAAAAPRPGEVALDLCCGTGDVAFALAARGAVVTGIDFSPAMLAVARRRPGRPPVTFVQGDAMALPVADASVDVVTVAYGLRSVADVGRALAEWRRVLRPGGRLLVLEFSRPAPLLRRPYDWYSFHVMPRLGGWIASDADSYRYLAESIRMHPDQETLKAMMQGCGFAHVDVHSRALT